MKYKILDINYSKKKDKRFNIQILDKDKNKILKFDFGLLSGDTYIDHKDKTKKLNYYKRHYNNKLEKNLIDNLILSPSLYSLFILWGKYTSIKDNIKHLEYIINKYDKFNENMIF
jgi:hypothetical protein